MLTVTGSPSKFGVSTDGVSTGSVANRRVWRKCCVNGPSRVTARVNEQRHVLDIDSSSYHSTIVDRQTNSTRSFEYIFLFNIEAGADSANAPCL